MVTENRNKRLLETAAENGYPFTIAHADGRCEEIIHNGDELESALRRHRRTPLMVLPQTENEETAA